VLCDGRQAGRRIAHHRDRHVTRRAALEVATSMGADAVIDVQKEDALARVLELTEGRGVDVVVDCTSGAGTAPVLLGIEAAKRRGATMVIQGEGNAKFPDFPIGV
jgi:NADPH:quinone reductase-like Zn-dependent oxidoreductase